jgi:hypothetical protein
MAFHVPSRKLKLSKDNKGGLDGVKLTRNFPAAVLNETINGKNPGGMAKRSIPL